MRLDLFVKLKYESSSIILSVGNIYSMHDLFPTSIIAWSDMRQMREMMSTLALASARLSKLWILYTQSVTVYIKLNCYLQTWFYQMCWFSRIAASNTATDDATN